MLAVFTQLLAVCILLLSVCTQLLAVCTQLLAVFTQLLVAFTQLLAITTQVLGIDGDATQLLGEGGCWELCVNLTIITSLEKIFYILKKNQYFAGNPGNKYCQFMLFSLCNKPSSLCCSLCHKSGQFMVYIV